MDDSEKLKIEIDNIKQRNQRVEADKAWEISIFRKVIIVVLTYLVIVIFLFFIGSPDPFKNAAVPAIAFFLSTLTVTVFKKLWLKYIYKGN